ncbi:Glu-tRNA(Gln) amidotransferase subunit GatE [bacterium]|nr:Glu-tRNA(Gln) amidotransferase subunit GatE [bacterium]
MKEPANNTAATRSSIGYLPRRDATPDTYKTLGFKCGLEIHQQLKTEKKLFCRCPAGLYQKPDDYNAELLRHMRPTLSELGEYDGTALMEFKTRKNIFYRVKNESACTYDFDDTPPFVLNREALDGAMKIALMLKCNIVGELHITRKQYLDGSIPTGFQRTAIVGIEGEIPLQNKTVRIIQLSIEEDSCREISDIGHERVYSTDRLGMPLIETVTYPDMLTPEEAAEAGQYLRFLSRSAAVVNTGIGAARQDVNVSITGGTRVEIKGVAHIKWIPDLTHNEAFRQKALLTIKEKLNSRVSDPAGWSPVSVEITAGIRPGIFNASHDDHFRAWAVNLPGFGGLLSFFTSPGRVFADEISDRLKVIACLEKPNMAHSEDSESPLSDTETAAVIKALKPGAHDAWLVLAGPAGDMATALETIEERCRLAFTGVPNETRKSLPDGTTIFERVLPGPDRMYPDTDSAPIPIADEMIETIRETLPDEISRRIAQLNAWKIPEDTYTYLLSRDLYPLLRELIEEAQLPPVFAGTLLGHTLKRAEGRFRCRLADRQRVIDLVSFVRNRGLQPAILKEALPALVRYQEKEIETLFFDMGFQPVPEEQLLAKIPELDTQFASIRTTDNPAARTAWIMGELRPLALGNINMGHLRRAVEGGRS